MKVQELLKLLAEVEPDREVRTVGQPAHPVAYALGRVVESQDVVYLVDEDLEGDIAETIAALRSPRQTTRGRMSGHG